MKRSLTILLLLPLLGFAQEAAKPQDPAKPAEEKKVEEAKPAEKQEEAKPAEPAADAPAVEQPFTSNVEFGYRSLLTRTGNLETYRTVVNLGEGPKLFNADFNFSPPNTKYFDSASLFLRNWGGEPFSTLRADVSKANKYKFGADYRNLAHYNFLPSFANPLLGTGSLLNQRAFDTRILSTDMRLDLFPSARFSPYVTYSRNSELGGGVWLFSREGNEFPVPTLIDSANNHFAGGLSMRMKWLHAAIEQGGTRFRDDQASDENISNPGNLRRPYFGRNIRLTDLAEQYRVRGDSFYTRGTAALNPFEWLSVNGDFTYTKPNIDVAYDSNAQGTFFVLRNMLDASAGVDRFRGAASMPRPAGSVRAEFRPTHRIRIVEWWMTDRMVNSTTAQLVESFLTTGRTVSATRNALDRLEVRDTRQQIDLYIDLLKSLTLRGGHRYHTGNAEIRGSIYINPLSQTAQLRRNVALATMAYKPGPKLRISGDYEGARTSEVYFHMSLRNYDRFHGRISVAPNANWRFGFDYNWFDNKNPDPAINWNFHSHTANSSVEWFPRAGKYFSILTDYTWSTVGSTINILDPESLRRNVSEFYETGNGATMLVRFQPRLSKTRQAIISLGGTIYVNDGSRPTNYYLPQARVSLPVVKHMTFNGEWRWISYNQRQFAFENFGSHQLMISLTVHR